MTDNVNYDVDVPDWLIDEAEYQMEEFGNTDESREEKSDSIYIKIVDINKRRVYVDDISEVPDWATPQEGDRDPDAIYYETDDAPDDYMPEELKYDLSTLESMDDDEVMEEEDIAAGGFADKMFIGENSDGERLFFQTPTSYEPTKSRFISAKIAMDAMDVRAPNMAYDEENDFIVMEDIGENSNRVYAKADEVEDVDKDDFLRSIAAKIIVADTDIRGNIMLDDNGKFYPIDYDFAGRDLKHKREQHNKIYTGERESSVLDYDTPWLEHTLESVQGEGEKLFPNISKDDLIQALQSLVEEFDDDYFKEQANVDEEYINSTELENIQNNVEYIRSGEIFEGVENNE